LYSFMESPVCSVILFAHNCRDRLHTALSSAAMQRAGNIEIIVLHDGSAGGTAAWLEERSRQWPALRAIETGGTGRAEARNAAIEAARAPLIAFLDADDWWWPGKLRGQIAFHAANPETAFSFTDYLHISPDGESGGRCFEYWRPRLSRRPVSGYFRLQDALSVILETNLAGTSTVVANKTALEKAGGFRPLPSAADWALWLELASQGSVACNKAITVSYLVRTSGITANREARIAAMAQIVAPYGKSPSVTVRRAAVKAQARIGVASTELTRLSGRHSSAALYHSSAFMALPSARLGKESKASALTAALHFVSGYGASS
jgi:glycosyltransferase involved in cell wall biosynthesis